MPRGKRQLSRKGCFSCKKLKIKCDEAKPSCEYCTHTGRDCAYPEPIAGIPSNISAKKSKTPEISPPSTVDSKPSGIQSSATESDSWQLYPSTYENSQPFSPAELYEGVVGQASDSPRNDFFFENRAQTFFLPRLLNAVGSQLRVTRFELRLLRFFHDRCIPIMTFNMNKKADIVWRELFPRYFGSLDLVRQATYAVACINMWPETNLPYLLESDHAQYTSEALQDVALPADLFSHVFDKISVFEKTNESIFQVTTAYFISTLEKSRNLAGKDENRLTYDDLAQIYFSGFLIFAYAGVHPHCVMPLVDFESECPSDFIGFFCSMRQVFVLCSANLRQQVVDNLIEHSLVAPDTGMGKVGIVEVLRLQLTEYYFANAAFSEINAQICQEHETLKDALLMLENCFLSTLKEGHPTPFFKFLALLDEPFIQLARNRNFFALRMLFNFACICIYCQFYLLFHENVWAQYVAFFLENYSPLCASDLAMYEHVVIKGKAADVNHFVHDLLVLNKHCFEFGGRVAPGGE